MGIILLKKARNKELVGNSVARMNFALSSRIQRGSRKMFCGQSINCPIVEIRCVMVVQKEKTTGGDTVMEEGEI